MSDTYNFDDKARLPVRPLSYENKDLAHIHEVVIDYNKGVIYVKLSDGRLINTATSMDTINAIIDYLKDHPEIIAGMVIKDLDGNDISIQDAFLKIFDILSKPIPEAEKLVNSLTIKIDENSNLKFDGSKPTNIDLSVYFNKNTGGTIYGDTIFNKKIIISSESYGPKLPETGVEGQIFFKILTDLS